MNFLELIEKTNNLNIENKNDITNIVNNININWDNFDQWINNVFSEKISQFNMGKLPYIIDELYKSNDKIKFMLCCMLLESTCDKLEFVTNLENYQLFVTKFETMLNTLVTVYETVDNGIANCMALIMLKNDPKFERFDDKLKQRLIIATRRKLNDILNYLKNNDEINPLVYEDVEVIVDLACYLNDKEISNYINQIDEFKNNSISNIYIIKYKIVNKLKLIDEKVETIKNDEEYLYMLYKIMEELDVNNIYLKDVTQEMIAKSDMVRWLCYPTELGSKPDNIEMLGSFIFNNSKCFAFKFSKESFSIKGDLLGITGGYPVDKVSSISSGFTFSKFDILSNDWKNQALDLAKFILSCWENKK